MKALPPVDGNVELLRLLDSLSERSDLAAGAPRGAGLYRYLSAGLAAEGFAGEYWRLTEQLLTQLSIWWSDWAYLEMPIMVPWAIRDRRARYDFGPEMWGSPREDGFFRDDNSIVKKLPLPLAVEAPPGHPYAGRKPWRGFTACHIWRDLPGGKVGGADPWVYSFMPNLVWLPTALAPLSDRHESHVQQVLQRTSRRLFDEEHPQILQHAAYAWSQLPAPPSGKELDVGLLARFNADRAFVNRRLRYTDRFIAGADEVVRTGKLGRKLISSRYTAALPGLQTAAVAQFRDTLVEYRDSVYAGQQSCSGAGSGVPVGL